MKRFTQWVFFQCVFQMQLQFPLAEASLMLTEGGIANTGLLFWTNLTAPLLSMISFLQN